MRIVGRRIENRERERPGATCDKQHLHFVEFTITMTPTFLEPGRYRSRFCIRRPTTKLMGNNHPSLMQVLLVSCMLLLLCAAVQAKGKTVYVHLLDGDDARGDGNYTRPFKSWRVALRHVGSGDTIVAKNGDYRKSGREGNWGGLKLILTMGDQLEPGDPRQPVPPRTPPDTIGIYRYDPADPLTIRAESNQGVIIDHIRFHLTRGIVIEGFEIFPNPYYTDDQGKKLNRRVDGIHGDSVYEH